jgi:hypothetical protein
MAWHVYEFEKNASSSSGMFSMSEWKERLAADAGEYAASRVDMELADAVGAAREAGWRGEVQGEPRIFVLPNEEEFQFGFVWTGTQAYRSDHLKK